MTRLRLAILTTLVIALTAGCGSGAPTTLIGVRKMSLALAFKDPSLTPPPPAKVLVTIVPATPEAIQLVVPEYRPLSSVPVVPPAALPPVNLCPKAAPDATPDQPAAVAITQPPKEGTYIKLNQGTVRIEGGVVPLTLPYPEFTKITISNVKQTEQSDLYKGSVKVTTFETQENLTSSLVQHNYYSYDDTQLNLVRSEIVSDGQVTAFQPTPALEVLPFTGPGNTWNAAGADTSSGSAETVQGSIDAKREIVDLCGKVVDTLRVSTDEHTLSMTDGSSTGSNSGQPIVQNYAPQLGLVVRREEHSTRVTSINGARVVVYIDVVSKLMSIEPRSDL